MADETQTNMEQSEEEVTEQLAPQDQSEDRDSEWINTDSEMPPEAQPPAWRESRSHYEPQTLPDLESKPESEIESEPEQQDSSRPRLNPRRWARDDARSWARPERQAKKPRRSVVPFFVVAIVALLLGVVLGMLAAPMLPGRQAKVELAGRISVGEDELDNVLGTYTFDGERIPVTIRDAILESTTLEAARNSDGTYDVPSVDTVLSIARNHVLEADAQARGITVTEEDAKAYARDTLGTDDYTQIAAGYNMDTNQVQQLMLRSALLGKLRSQVVTTPSVAEPVAPTTAEAGKEDEPSQLYATYIMGLVGDEWDANANTWAREDGPYREQLKNYTISNEAATYSAAQAAYFVAYSQYSQVQQQVSTEWTNYVNGLLSNVSVELISLVA